MLEKNDASLLLVFDPSPPGASSSEERDLPLRIYETAHDAGGASLGGARLMRVGGWKIESGEAERVAVSSVSQDQFGGTSSAGESSRASRSVARYSSCGSAVPSLTCVLILTRSVVVPNLTTLRNAVQMLSSRTQVILAYLRGVSDGSLRRDDEVLRMIGGLVAGLPVEEGQAFRAEFETVSAPALREVSESDLTHASLLILLRSTPMSSSRVICQLCPNRCFRSTMSVAVA